MFIYILLKNERFRLLGLLDFVVNSDSSITQAKKDEAIKSAISKTLTDIFSKISVNSFK